MGRAWGNVLEWYDFTVYAYLAGILGRKFFDSSNETAAILATFAVFGVGFVARPLGGLLIGMIGDRYGRKPTLLLTFTLIAVSTGLIGVLPIYATIGLAAPILLVLARLLQGVSAGGEWGGAAVVPGRMGPRRPPRLLRQHAPLRDHPRPVAGRRRDRRVVERARLRRDVGVGLARAVPAGRRDWADRVGGGGAG